MVSKDIMESIKVKGGNGTHTIYWEKNEQVVRLGAAFDQWAKKENVWSAAAAAKVSCL